VLYFIRHGQTDANLNRINAGGEYDVPLNETGKAQACAFAAAQQPLIESLDAVYVSPMIRAQQTMELIIAGHNKPVEVVENLREWKLGTWSKLTYEATPNLFTTNDAPEEGESRLQFFKRGINALQYVNTAHSGKILVVAHGGIWYSYAHYAAHQVTDLANCAHQEMCRKTLGGIKA
jgi:2,3-bisphosphoglycerate-dependent phosphoglycerate mutase